VFEKIDFHKFVSKREPLQFGRTNITAKKNRTAGLIFFLNGDDRMTDPDDLKLKTEIDEIMKSVDSIMMKVETVMPPKQGEAQPQSDGSTCS
jgi:hypothetical protein